jgi:predicted enzyme related to lactoylglutathione lyase
MIYLNASGRLDEAVAAVPMNGGSVIKSKHAIGPFGFRAIVIDSEGNRVALHSE